MNRITIQESKNDYSFNDIAIGRFFTINDENVFYIKISSGTKNNALACYINGNEYVPMSIEYDTPIIRYDANITLILTKDD